VDCVGCELGALIVSWRCFRGLGSGLGLEEMTADDAFLAGDRRRDCKVGVGVDRATGVSLKDWLDGLDGRGIDKVGGRVSGISWFIAFL
jgi:hypothetical protein